jgi:hypothetical protein
VKSSDVRDAAAELTKRIIQFTEYLSGLSGRIEATAWGLHPDADSPQSELELGLKFHKQGGRDWIISWSDYYPAHHEIHGMDWTPLVTAPLKIKLAAVKMFPDLLESIEKSQDRIVAEIQRTSMAFDEFVAGLPTGKERKK